MAKEIKYGAEARKAVSYPHLDVYKRQTYKIAVKNYFGIASCS